MGTRVTFAVLPPLGVTPSLNYPPGASPVLPAGLLTPSPARVPLPRPSCPLRGILGAYNGEAQMPFARGSPVTRFSATYVEINLILGDVGLDTQASAGPVPI